MLCQPRGSKQARWLSVQQQIVQVCIFLFFFFISSQVRHAECGTASTCSHTTETGARVPPANQSSTFQPTCKLAIGRRRVIYITVLLKCKSQNGPGKPSVATHMHAHTPTKMYYTVVCTSSRMSLFCLNNNDT